MKTQRREDPLATYILEDGSREAYLRDVKKGDYVSPRRRDPKFLEMSRCNRVYRKGDYDRSTKRFELIDCEDTNRVLYVKGSNIVMTGFTY